MRRTHEETRRTHEEMPRLVNLCVLVLLLGGCVLGGSPSVQIGAYHSSTNNVFTS